jgi:hypothetical protein
LRYTYLRVMIIPPKSKGLVLSVDNPFRSQIVQQQSQSKVSSRSQSMTGSLLEEEYTMTVKRSYLPFPFSKLFQNKELLAGLTPDACKVVVHIALHLDYQCEKIKLNWKEVGLSKRMLSKASLELVERKVLVKEKREWYWVNVSLIVVGVVTRHE